MEFTTEQIEKARNCKTLEEFKSLAKAEGIELSDEETKEYFDATRMGELTDDDLSSVAGGAKGGKWEDKCHFYHLSKCPFCGVKKNLDIHKLVHTKTKEVKYISKPDMCVCGAKIVNYFPSNRCCFYMKNGRTVSDSY